MVDGLGATDVSRFSRCREEAWPLAPYLSALVGVDVEEEPGHADHLLVQCKLEEHDACQQAMMTAVQTQQVRGRQPAAMLRGKRVRDRADDGAMGHCS